MGWPILLVTTLTEVFRLYFGWGGNLQEQVSHMSSFLLVTAFPVFPCVLFLAFALPGRFFFEVAGGTIELLFLVRSDFVVFYRKWVPSTLASMRHLLTLISFVLASVPSSFCTQFVEFVLAYRANKKIIRRKTAAFLRLCQEDAETVGAGSGGGAARMQQKID